MAIYLYSNGGLLVNKLNYKNQNEKEKEKLCIFLVLHFLFHFLLKKITFALRVYLITNTLLTLPD